MCEKPHVTRPHVESWGRGAGEIRAWSAGEYGVDAVPGGAEEGEGLVEEGVVGVGLEAAEGGDEGLRVGAVAEARGEGAALGDVEGGGLGPVVEDVGGVGEGVELLEVGGV